MSTAAPGDAPRTDAPARSPREIDGPVPLADALGGVQGVTESSVPAIAFVLAYLASGQDVGVAAGVALALGVVLTGVRLARRQTVQFAFAGLIGVGVAAFVATRTGRGEDFFLPGLIQNAAFITVWGGSIAIRRPLLGVLLSTITQEGMAWRRDPAKLRAYTRASWIWVGLFAARLIVQVPLYLAGAVVALGVARVAMGLPLFLIGAWLSFLVLRREGLVGSPDR